MSFMDKSDDKQSIRDPLRAVYAGHLQRHKLGRKSRIDKGTKNILVTERDPLSQFSEM